MESENRRLSDYALKNSGLAQVKESFQNIFSALFFLTPRFLLCSKVNPAVLFFGGGGGAGGPEISYFNPTVPFVLSLNV